MSTIHYLPTAVPACNRFDNFKASLPIKVSAAKQGIDGFVTLDFGASQAQDPVTGDAQFDWHLWVYMCDWELYQDSKRLLWRRESDPVRAAETLSQLAGKLLLAVDHDESDDCFIWRFEGGFRLHIDPDFYGYEPDSDLFMLFKHGEGDCISYNPRRHFYRAA
ncbi:MAG: hypothetical protein JKY60_13610 [Kordiimonadaceae bacterium]|nr:hypothetical protein [Kordiimonadaceae bacterium]